MIDGRPDEHKNPENAPFLTRDQGTKSPLLNAALMVFAIAGIFSVVADAKSALTPPFDKSLLVLSVLLILIGGAAVFGSRSGANASARITTVLALLVFAAGVSGLSATTRWELGGKPSDAAAGTGSRPSPTPTLSPSPSQLPESTVLTVPLDRAEGFQPQVGVMLWPLERAPASKDGEVAFDCRTATDEEDNSHCGAGDERNTYLMTPGLGRMRPTNDPFEDPRGCDEAVGRRYAKAEMIQVFDRDTFCLRRARDGAVFALRVEDVADAGPLKVTVRVSKLT